MEPEVTEDDIYTQQAEEAGLGDYISGATEVYPQEEEVESDDYDEEADVLGFFQDFDESPTDDDIEEVRHYSPSDADRLVTNRAYKNSSIPVYDSRAKASGVPANGKQLFAKFVQRGENPMLIAGLLGNAMAESSLNPGAVGDHGTSEGLFQWHNERRTGLRNYLKGKDNSAENHVNYALIELKRDYPEVYKAASMAKTPSESAYIVAKGFEKPKVINKERMSYAEGFASMQDGGLNPWGTKNLDPLNYQTFNPLQRAQQTGIPMPALGYTPVSRLPTSNPDSWFGGATLNHDLPLTSKNPLNSGALTKLDPTGKSQLIGAIDDKGSQLVNTVNNVMKGYKSLKGAIGQGVDAGVTGISAILGEKKNQRDYYKMLEKLYGEGSYGDNTLTTQLKPKEAYVQHGY